MSTLPSTLQTALEYHRSGNLEKAEAMYREIVAGEPSNADALHLLGVAAHQRGDHTRAIETIQQAISMQKMAPLYHSNLGAAYRASGQIEKAMECFQTAIELKPDFAEGYYNIGLALEMQGQLDRAVQNYEKANELAPTFSDAFLNRGRVLSQLGRNEEAIRCYEQGLMATPDCAELAYNLGNALQASGSLNEAVDAYRKAISLRPDIADIYNNLGTSLKGLDRIEEASECFEQALALDPDHSDARCNLTAIHRTEITPDESIREFEDALVREPENTKIRCALAFSLQEQERYDESAPLFERAIQDEPNRADLHFALGYAYLSQARSGKARRCYERGLELDPQNKNAWNTLGTILISQDELEQAAECFQKALMIDPQDATAHYNLGNVYKDQNQWERALVQYDRSIEIDPELSAAYINRGVVLKNLGRLSEAIDSHTQALQIGDRNAEAGFHRALAMLANGDFEQGWNEYEYRWQYEATPRKFSLPVWDGSSLHERSLFIYAEQGVGDEIMFASCLPDIIPQTRRCTVECDHRLVPLFARSFPLATVIARPRLPDAERELSPPECELQIAMGSLPRYSRTSLDAFPVSRRRYLAPDSQLLAKWSSRFADFGANLKVGISWRGGNHPDIRKRRSTTLTEWESILRTPGVKFVNLQYGDCQEELDVARKKTGVMIHDWDDANPLENLDDFAAQIAALDLVISIDNSTVHMAGALGVPVWTLLPVAPNWRWLNDQDDSPWYASMRLFRQETIGEWSSVFREVARELAQRAGQSVESNDCFEQRSATEKISQTEMPEQTQTSENSERDEAAEKEQRKYETIWTHDVYREKSPGLDDADKIQLIEHLRQRQVKSILDAGCGSGKLMQRLLTEHGNEFTVHGFDISRNCLDPFFDDIKDEILTVGCLWNADDMPGVFDAVICTDVLEHIPTEHIPAVLANLRSCTLKMAYLAIALFPDGFGPQLIGEPLHLTVKPPNWWYAQIGVAGFKIEAQAVEKHVSGQDMWLHVLATV
ncbi:MAG: hypothetical protein Tsb009_34960 [Planctomycetaceae bacterium]